MRVKLKSPSRGLSALELVVTLSIIIAAYGIYLYSVGGHNPVRVKEKAAAEHIKTLSHLIESQKIELGCRPTTIRAMVNYNNYANGENSCGTQVFINPWNGPYLGELKFKSDSQGGRVLLDYIHKGYYGVLTDNGECYFIKLKTSGSTALSVTLAQVVAERTTACSGGVQK